MQKDKRVDDLLSEANKRGSTKHLMSSVVGMPDEEDKRIIQKIIINYEDKKPGQITDSILEARQENKEGNKNSLNTTNKGSNSRLVLRLPEELAMQLQKYIPTLFRDKKHFEWFVKNFKHLMVPEEY